MAKALYGHMGSGPPAGSEFRLANEIRRLRTRVAELEAEVAALRDAMDVDAVRLVPNAKIDLRESAPI